MVKILLHDLFFGNNLTSEHKEEINNHCGFFFIISTGEQSHQEMQTR